jgi:hypothetical protein
MRKPSNTSGQYILRGVLQLLDELKARGINSEFRWIPAHRGILGNEAADTAAKEAAGWTLETIWTTRGNQKEGQDEEQEATEGVQTLITTAKRTINEGLRDDWETLWVHRNHGR